MHLKLRASNHSVPVPTISLTHCMGLGQSTASGLSSCSPCRKIQVAGESLSEGHVTHTNASSAKNALRNVKIAHQMLISRKLNL